MKGGVTLNHAKIRSELRLTHDCVGVSFGAIVANRIIGLRRTQMILFHKFLKFHIESNELETTLMNDEHFAPTTLKSQEI
jgi:hypothetical protein